MNDKSQPERQDGLEAWIKQEFAGHGIAVRLQDEPPIPSEPFISMAEAKELTRRAVAKFATPSSSNGAEGAGDIARCLETIENSYAFKTFDGIPLKNCGEWIYLKKLLAAPPKPAPLCPHPFCTAYPECGCQMPAPDAQCFTAPNGDCISPNPCMHTATTIAPDAMREALAALEPFTKLGGGQNPRDTTAGLYYAAYYDLPGSGAFITADDVRTARRVYKMHFISMSSDWAQMEPGRDKLYSRHEVQGIIRSLSPATRAAEPVASWQRRNIGPDGRPWSTWYPANGKPTPENVAWDGTYSYEYRLLYAASLVRGDRASDAEDIRMRGWSVAVHNDYQLNNLRHTFWLFTKDGRAVKGEGRTDADALNQVRAILSLPVQTGAK